MPSVTPAFESSPSAAVSPLIDKSVPILMGSFAAMVTQPNSSALQSTVEPVLPELPVVLPPLSLLEQPLATSANTLPMASVMSQFRRFIDPPLVSAMQMWVVEYHIRLPKANPVRLATTGYARRPRPGWTNPREGPSGNGRPAR